MSFIKIRLDSILTKSKFTRDKDCLDIGVGKGYGIHLLNNNYRSLVGIDIHDKSISCAKKLENKRIKIIKMDAEDINFKEKPDINYCRESNN